MKAIKNEIENEQSLKCDNKKITSFKKIIIIKSITLAYYQIDNQSGMPSISSLFFTK